MHHGERFFWCPSHREEECRKSVCLSLAARETLWGSRGRGPEGGGVSRRCVRRSLDWDQLGSACRPWAGRAHLAVRGSVAITGTSRKSARPSHNNLVLAVKSQRDLSAQLILPWSLTPPHLPRRRRTSDGARKKPNEQHHWSWTDPSLVIWNVRLIKNTKSNVAAPEWTNYGVAVVPIRCVGYSFPKRPTARSRLRLLANVFVLAICLLPRYISLVFLFPLLFCLCGRPPASSNPTPWTIKAVDPLVLRDPTNNHRYPRRLLTRSRPSVQPMVLMSPIRPTSPSRIRSVALETAP